MDALAHSIIPPELHAGVLTHVDTGAQFVRASLVCKQWNALLVPRYKDFINPLKYLCDMATNALANALANATLWQTIARTPDLSAALYCEYESYLREHRSLVLSSTRAIEGLDFTNNEKIVLVSCNPYLSERAICDWFCTAPPPAHSIDVVRKNILVNGRQLTLRCITAMGLTLRDLVRPHPRAAGGLVSIFGTNTVRLYNDVYDDDNGSGHTHDIEGHRY